LPRRTLTVEGRFIEDTERRSFSRRRGTSGIIAISSKTTGRGCGHPCELKNLPGGGQVPCRTADQFQRRDSQARDYSSAQHQVIVSAPPPLRVDPVPRPSSPPEITTGIPDDAEHGGDGDHGTSSNTETRRDGVSQGAAALRASLQFLQRLPGRGCGHPPCTADNLTWCWPSALPDC